MPPSGTSTSPGLARFLQERSHRWEYTAMSDKIIANFEDRHRALWGRHTVRLQHTLAERELFSDAGIAELIDSLPSERLAINTMAPDGHRLESWGYCDRAGQKGEDLLALVKSGRLWINMTKLD